jgi:regulator of RNase E activity RraB
MVDISAEVERLSKRLSKMQVEYDGLVARLISAEVERLSKRLSKMQVEYDGLVARLSSQKV